jgi:8-oxo-dGTP pyrophosphatase MutT (NUDIX family)
LLLKKSLVQLEPLPKGEPKTSSVLIPLGWNENTEQHEILLTKRTELVHTHKGQVSFPGGYWEPGDKSLLDTALREAQEEIGLQPQDVETVGALPRVQTRGEIWIQPWVALMRFPYSFNLNPNEVDRLLFLSLNTLKEVGLKEVDVNLKKFTVKSPGIPVDGELVWGATAQMLHLLRSCLRGEPLTEAYALNPLPIK